MDFRLRAQAIHLIALVVLSSIIAPSLQSGQVGDDVKIIDATGKFVMPG
nr:dihydropyrimidinase [Ipomoea batatas]